MAGLRKLGPGWSTQRQPDRHSADGVAGGPERVVLRHRFEFRYVVPERCVERSRIRQGLRQVLYPAPDVHGPWKAVLQRPRANTGSTVVLVAERRHRSAAN